MYSNELIKNIRRYFSQKHGVELTRVRAEQVAESLGDIFSAFAEDGAGVGAPSPGASTESGAHTHGGTVCAPDSGEVATEQRRPL